MYTGVSMKTVFFVLSSFKLFRNEDNGYEENEYENGFNNKATFIHLSKYFSNLCIIVKRKSA